MNLSIGGVDIGRVWRRSVLLRRGLLVLFSCCWEDWKGDKAWPTSVPPHPLISSLCYTIRASQSPPFALWVCARPTPVAYRCYFCCCCCCSQLLLAAGCWPDSLCALLVAWRWCLCHSKLGLWTLQSDFSIFPRVRNRHKNRSAFGVWLGRPNIFNFRLNFHSENSQTIKKTLPFPNIGWRVPTKRNSVFFYYFLFLGFFVRTGFRPSVFVFHRYLASSFSRQAIFSSQPRADFFAQIGTLGAIHHHIVRIKR